MRLSPGFTLGSYTITAEIGKGGMGEVYRAHDSRLGRDVAIKVLPELFAVDAERVARFEREAQAVAALSHPNILAIHDIGSSGSTSYAVMELLEGQTLRERLADGALPVRKALDIALQIAPHMQSQDLRLVESPDVPDSELREAVRWRIRDLIDFPVDEAAIDVFDMPQGAGSSGRETGKMMCVVVARNPVIAQKAGMVNRSGGELDVIDITDLALRNVLSLTAADATGVALLYVEPAYSLILITAESTLYLSRRIWIGANELAGIAGKESDSPEFRRVADALALELLRSLEYYESHFSRPAVESLYIAPHGAAEAALHAYLGHALGVQVQGLDLNRLLDTAEPLSAEQQARGLLAIGAALRYERATL